MLEIGTYHELEVLRFTSSGAFLSNGQDDVLLPNKFVTHDMQMGDMLRVFVYTDSSDRPVATTQHPKGLAGQFAFLKCVQTNAMGAFMDWGLDKDLLVPFAEQRPPLEADRSYVIRIVADPVSNRLYGSARLSRYFEDDTSSLTQSEAVELIVYRIAVDGALVVINNKYTGMLFNDEIFIHIRVGMKAKGYIKKIREDGKVSVALNPQGYEAVTGQAPTILESLKKAGGFLPFSDSSSPEEIRKAFGMSKGAFKKLIGTMMKQGLITIEYHGIRLINKDR